MGGSAYYITKNLFICGGHLILNKNNLILNKKYYLKSRSRGISYMKCVNRRLTGLVTFCVETAFYNRLLKER
jgi:hypothetical protein